MRISGDKGRPRPRTTGLRGEMLEAYRLLRAGNGHLHWWPGRTRLEIVTGAILTQNTAWTNVEKAINQMRAAGLLSLSALRTTGRTQLEEAIRPSGYFRQKALKLRAFVSFLDASYGGSFRRMGRAPTERLRTELLAIWGIGPETADSILLYAFGRPVFVIDAYTKRIAERHGWARGPVKYTQLQELFTAHLPCDVDLYNDYHAQLVWVGKHHCGTKPKCAGCHLAGLMPDAREMAPRRGKACTSPAVHPASHQEGAKCCVPRSASSPIA